MTGRTHTLVKGFKAGAAITKHRIVKHGTADDTAIQAAAATDKLLGVADNLGAAAANDPVDVVVAGIAEVEYGGTVTRGDLLTADANGKAITVARHTHTENTAGTYTQNATTGAGSAERVIGIAMASGVTGDIGSVLIAPAFA